MNPGRWGALYFAVLSIAVWTPALFQNGYVLLGDMVFTPAMHPPVSLLGPVHGTMDVALIYNLAWLLSRVFGAVLLQKAVLFLMVFLPGYLMYRNVPATSNWSRVFAGTLYAVNPFLYTRAIMGQWGFLLGFALLPVVFASAVKVARRPSAKRCVYCALWIAGTAALSLSAGALALAVALTVAVFEAVRRPRTLRAAGAILVVLLLFVMLSGFWLLPAFSSGTPASTIGRADLRAFETRSTSRAGTAVSVVGLYGYWKTQIDALLPRKYVPLWPVFGFLLIGLCLYGLTRFWSEPVRGPALGALALLGVAGFFLALGTKAPLTGSIFSFLFDHLAPFRLFREPQKFAALLILAYSVLGAAGVDRFLSRRLVPAKAQAGKRGRGAAVAVLLTLVFLYSFRMFGGLWGQAKAVSYPRSWAEARDILARDKGDWSALYLPPYWYMRFGFTNSDYTITDPMPLYFTNRYVPLTSIEIGPKKLDLQPVDAYVRDALDTARSEDNFGSMLAPLDVKYVLMPLNDASLNFRFLERQSDLQVVHRWSDLVLLRNRVPVSRLTLSRTTGSFTTWESAGRRSKGAVLAASYLPRGPTTLIPASRGKPIGSTESATGTISAVLPATSDGSSEPQTLLYSDPYSNYWRIEGAEGSAPREQLGVVTAFGVGTGGRPAKVKITYDNLLLPLGYALTVLALLSCAALVVRESWLMKRKKNGEG